MEDNKIRIGITQGFKSAVSFILVISANALSKKFSDDNTALF